MHKRKRRKYDWTPAGLELARKQRIGREPWNAGKTGIYSAASLRLMSKSHKGKVGWSRGLHVFVGSDNGMFGLSHSPETVEKIRIKQRLYHERKRIQKQNRSLAQKKRRLRAKLSNSAKAAWERRRRNNQT